MVAGPVGQQAQYMPNFDDMNVQFNFAGGERFGADKMTGKQMYYKKSSSATDPGYVVVASATPLEFVRMMDKGMQPLRQFGEFQLWNPAENWRVSNEPYRRIFQRPNGIMVFPIEQVLEHMWHIAPPYQGIVFPQLGHLANQEGGLDLHKIRCVECRRWYKSEEDRNKHRSVAHRQTSQNSALGEAIAVSVGKMNEPMQAALSPLLDALQQQMKISQAMMERLALSQAEQQQINEYLMQRANYGGDQGVPAPPPNEPAPTTPSEPPIEASSIDPNAQPVKGRRGS
jgi:hypothetical protein